MLARAARLLALPSHEPPPHEPPPRSPRALWKAIAAAPWGVRGWSGGWGGRGWELRVRTVGRVAGGGGDITCGFTRHRFAERSSAVPPATPCGAICAAAVQSVIPSNVSMRTRQQLYDHRTRRRPPVSRYCSSSRGMTPTEDAMDADFMLARKWSILVVPTSAKLGTLGVGGWVGRGGGRAG